MISMVFSELCEAAPFLTLCTYYLVWAVAFVNEYNRTHPLNKLGE